MFYSLEIRLSPSAAGISARKAPIFPRAAAALAQRAREKSLRVKALARVSAT
jgi:hypothetical protein